jgi:hypothetical protein
VRSPWREEPRRAYGAVLGLGSLGFLHEPSCFERAVALSVKLDGHARVGARIPILARAPRSQSPWCRVYERSLLGTHPVVRCASTQCYSGPRVSRTLLRPFVSRLLEKKQRSAMVHTRGVCSICVFSLQVGLKRIAIWKENTEIEPEGRVDYMYSARAHPRVVESWSADKNACHVNPPGSVLNLSDGSSGSSVWFSCVARQSTYASAHRGPSATRAHYREEPRFRRV